MEPPQASRLRRLWQEHLQVPFPGPDTRDPRLQEVALYATWLGSLVELALARGGRLSATHRLMLDIREAEGNRALWDGAAQLGQPVRAYVARLLEVQAALEDLPVEH